MRQEDCEFKGSLSYRVDFWVSLDYTRPCLEKHKERRREEVRGKDMRKEGRGKERLGGEKRNSMGKSKLGQRKMLVYKMKNLNRESIRTTDKLMKSSQNQSRQKCRQSNHKYQGHEKLKVV